jgi:hypothetical protein
MTGQNRVKIGLKMKYFLTLLCRNRSSSGEGEERKGEGEVGKMKVEKVKEMKVKQENELK